MHLRCVGDFFMVREETTAGMIGNVTRYDCNHNTLTLPTTHVMFAIFTRELGQVDVRRAKPSHVMFGIVTRDNKKDNSQWTTVNRKGTIRLSVVSCQ